jgi:ADP-L-glycero-D-manno-heptose 6-epimerase
VIVVTGGVGFIGAAVVRSLHEQGRSVLAVDHVAPAERPGLLPAGVEHLLPEGLLERLSSRGEADAIEAVVHQGACSSTLVDDEAYLRRVNDGYTIELIDRCRALAIPLVYASSAAVYGAAERCREGDPVHPLNAYARSKAAADAHADAVRSAPGSQLVGLRYFNVYGPGEDHKGAMASMVLQLWEQLRATGEARIFGAGAGCAAGQHRRDFVHVDDVVAVIEWFLAHPERSGTFNVATGRSRTFEELAQLVVAATGFGEVVHVPFPPALEARYQASTRADLSRLRAAGCDHRFMDLEEGVARYVRALAARSATEPR